ncbi:hypothetical protein RUM43_011623 [Polyplax serrata]|uniref:Uncharacterized protein n=1 Tax=Polyplax serrata TaxID=468196 RepID=A0AAN8S169_POLSC
MRERRRLRGVPKEKEENMTNAWFLYPVGNSPDAWSRTGLIVDYKDRNCLGGVGAGGGGSNPPQTSSGPQNEALTPTPIETNSLSSNSDPQSPGPSGHHHHHHHQQFNIFPAIFSRQLNFASNCSGSGVLGHTSGILGHNSGVLGNGLSHGSTVLGVGNSTSVLSHNAGVLAHNSTVLAHGNNNHTQKLMDELRPNLVGGLLGVAGLVDDVSHHERSLSLDIKPLHRSGKCSTSSSASEDFSALYGALPTSGSVGSTGGDNQAHQHTPTHTPPNVGSIGRNLSDHSSKLYTSIYILIT